MIGVANRRQPVGHDHDGSAARQLAHDLGDGRLVLAVEGRGDLVKQEDGRVLEEGPRDGDPLALAAVLLLALLSVAAPEFL